MNSECMARIIKVNLKHNFVPQGIAASLITLAVLVVFSISSLSSALAAQPLEMLLSLTGIAMLTPIFVPEQNENIRDVIRSRKMSYWNICVLRLICSVLFLALLFGIFTLWMKNCGSDVTLRHAAGGFATALILGAIGFCVSGISDNTICGYMTAMLYYIINFAMKKQLGHFYLFSMSSGSFNEKYWLLGGAGILFAATFIAIAVRYRTK